MSTGASNSDSAGSFWGSQAARAIVIGGIVLTLLLFGYLSVQVGGVVVGEEFSPDSFSRRGYTYFEIPVIHVQVSPVAYLPITDRVLARLAADKILPAMAAATPRWDFVAQEGTPKPGNALILVRYLDHDDANGTAFWEKWTADHPAKAKVLWPRVGEVSREGLYVFLPDVFDAAERAATAAELDATLTTILSEKYHRWGDIHEKLARPDLALKYYERALLLNPERTDSKERLEELRKAPAVATDAPKSPDSP